MKIMKIKSYFILVCFFILTVFPHIGWYFQNKIAFNAQEQNYENRLLAEFPDIRTLKYSEIPGAVDAFVNDHIPYRDDMIKLVQYICYSVFKSSNGKDVCIGKDGWLFFTGEQSNEYFTGRKYYTDEQLELISDNLQSASDMLAKKGIDFVLFIAPDKESIYFKYLPDYYSSPSENSAMLQIINYLREHTNVKVVCPYNELLEAKDEDVLLYHKTDTHWNEAGGFIGAQLLLEEMGIYNNLRNGRIASIEDTPGDLLNMLNLSEIVDPGMNYYVEGISGHNIVEIERDFWTHYRFKSAGDFGRLMVVRDSFCDAMIPFLCSEFEESDMVHEGEFSIELVDTFKPNYFVFEVVERRLDSLLYFNYWG